MIVMFYKDDMPYFYQYACSFHPNKRLAYFMNDYIVEQK